MNSKKHRPKIGLALGGGGAKGFAHVGIIKVLERNNIPIDYIAGTSMGALVGGFYAACKNIDYVEDVAVHSNIRQFASLMFELTRGGGLIGGDKVLAFLKSGLDEVDFSELGIPLAVVATELDSGEIHYFEKSGDVAEAIRASISYPPVFAPVKIKNKIYVDGGLSCQVPVDKVRQMGADIVIAVDLEEDYVFHRETMGNAYKVFHASIKVLMRELSKYNSECADVVIVPLVGKYRTWRDFDKTKKLIKIGEIAGRKALKSIKKLL